ncbi:MAG: class I adenylate-forming enzyme family protein [Hyphomonas sp.]
MSQILVANKSFYETFSHAATKHSDASIVVHSDTHPQQFTLDEVFKRGRAVGAHLQSLGVGDGDVVAVMLPAWSEWLTAMVGAAYAGAVFLPIVTAYKAKELAFVLRQSKARVILTPETFRGVDYVALLKQCGPLSDLKHHFVVGKNYAAIENGPAGEDPFDVSSETFAFLVYTSGTTADPKGVMHSSATLLSELDAQATSRNATGDQVYLSPWPPGHVAGALQLLRFLVHGTPLVTMDQWSAEDAAMLVETHGITDSSGTPFHMIGILEAAAAGQNNLSSFQNYVLGAAPVPATLVQQCVDLGINVVHAYGSSEHPTVTMGKATDSLESRLNTEGGVMPGSEIIIVDENDSVLANGEGEILTRGPELFLGYFDTRLNQSAFLTGGWYRTGDVGHLDKNGHLLITDRKKDIIIRGGENISSREVEDAMRQMPGVIDAAAIAVPDSRFGERVKVFVESTSEAPSIDQIVQHFLSLGITKQKTPEFVERISALPRNATGKVLKAELRKRAAGH